MSDGSKRRAAALQYLGIGAPKLVAKGEGFTAARIEELARQHDIPLVQDTMLTNLLGSVPLGDEIPENLYVAVAEVLALIYRMGDSVDSYE
jgi:flagellar biosynthesis protein